MSKTKQPATPVIDTTTTVDTLATVAPAAPTSGIAGTAPGYDAGDTARVEQIGPLTVTHR
jgi:hypothetical protein